MGPASADEDTQNPSPSAATPALSPAVGLTPGAETAPDAAASEHALTESAFAESAFAESAERHEGGETPSPAPLAGFAPTSEPAPPRPSFVFFGVVAGLSLAADIASKVWAEWTLNRRGFEPLELIHDHLAITLAYNRGGAWGLFASASDLVRKPFFLGVSIAAIAFIISLYARLTTRQKALKWGLPLVLGGALGNLNDRITRSQVIDFIDYRADWIMDLNVLVHRYVPTWAMTDHWPTFNVADVAICVGVGLMAVDMFTHRPRRVVASAHPSVDTVAPPPPGPTRMDAAVGGPDAGRPEAPPAVG